MFGLKFIKFQPSMYVLKYKNGKIVKEGPGLSFYYYAPSTSIALIPMGSVDAPFIFEEVTSDYQNVTVQGQIAYRIIDHKRIAGLLNYSLDIKRMNYISDDPRKLEQRMINIVRVLTKKHLENLPLQEAVKTSEALAHGIFSEIKRNEELKSLGLEVLGLSILAVNDLSLGQKTHVSSRYIIEQGNNVELPAG